MIPKKTYQLLFLLLGGVYLAGLFVTLFENDSAQFAVMAMRMVQENDFINLFKGPEEYLDKPHMHYWLAALSYLIFGIHDWAYRLPALLSIALGAYSCYGLGKVLYNRDTGKLAALIFLSSQTIVLSGIDVRTDAVLTGFTAFAIWQLAAYIESRRILPLLLGAIGAGVAFSTKGQIALLVIALPLLCHLAYTKKWKVLLDWRILAALLLFLFAISPMLYAYYHQFDLHPEKVIRGRDHRSGILFIFWEQSFERLSGEGMGKNSSDYFFFFHTFLWVFLPWTILGIAAYWRRLKLFLSKKGSKGPGMELLTIGGITLIFIIISFAQFKLPHYLNITIPLFSVLTASYIAQGHEKEPNRAGRFLLYAQYVVFGLVLLVCLLLLLVVFPVTARYAAALAMVVAASSALLFLKNKAVYRKIVLLAAFAAILLNAFLNLHFYPSLLEYQAGSAMANIVEKEQIPANALYKLSERYSWSLDFYNRDPVNITSPDQLKSMNDLWVYLDEKELNSLEQDGVKWDKKFRVDNFRITRLQMRFLNPKSRPGVLEHMFLIHIP